LIRFTLPILMTEPDSEDAKWDAYPNTILEFLGPTPLRIDLRLPVSAEIVDGLRRIGLDGPFGVFTAENPRGENVEDEESARQAEKREEVNDRRTTTLERLLTRSGTPFVLVDGLAPDGDYREHCVAVLTSRSEVVHMAKRFEQLALFWFDGSAFWLVPAEIDQTPRRLPA
jgi:hypothetical protein